MEAELKILKDALLQHEVQGTPETRQAVRTLISSIAKEMPADPSVPVPMDHRLVALKDFLQANPVDAFPIPFCLSVEVAASARSHVVGVDAPIVCMVISTTAWSSIISDKSWQTVLDPVTEYQVVMSGFLATAFGMPILSDCFSDLPDRFLEKDDVVLFSQTTNLEIRKLLRFKSAAWR